MSTVKTQTQKSTIVSKTMTASAANGNQDFLFDRSNYTWMLGGVVLIVIGLMLMSGGKSTDPHVFNYDEIFSARRITIAPLMILIGFAVEVYAIMKKHATNAE